MTTFPLTLGGKGWGGEAVKKKPWAYYFPAGKQDETNGCFVFQFLLNSWIPEVNWWCPWIPLYLAMGPTP